MPIESCHYLTIGKLKICSNCYVTVDILTRLNRNVSGEVRCKAHVFFLLLLFAFLFFANFTLAGCNDNQIIENRIINDHFLRHYVVDKV